MTRVWDDLEQRLPTPEDRATLFSAGLHAGAVARDCVAAMHAAAGTTALYVDCPLERTLRDVNTMAQHGRATAVVGGFGGEYYWGTHRRIRST